MSTAEDQIKLYRPGRVFRMVADKPAGWSSYPILERGELYKVHGTCEGHCTHRQETGLFVHFDTLDGKLAVNHVAADEADQLFMLVAEGSTPMVDAVAKASHEAQERILVLEEEREAQNADLHERLARIERTLAKLFSDVSRHEKQTVDDIDAAMTKARDEFEDR